MPNFVNLRWLQRYHRLLLWGLGISLLPPLVLLALSYYQAITVARSQLNKTAEQNALQISSLIRAADLTLRELEVYLDNLESNKQAAWMLLQRIAYNDPRFREVGIVDEQGYLVVTSLGPVEPPILIDSGTRADLTLKELQIIGPVTTSVMEERSIVLVLPTQGLGELNILIDPGLLKNFGPTLGSVELGNDGFLAYVNTRNNQIIGGVGPLPRTASTLFESSRRDRIRVKYPIAQTDITIVGEVSRNWALRGWVRLLVVMVPVVLATSLMVIIALARLTYFAHLLDYDIRIGLKNQEFELYFQPIFHLETNTCIGAEALIRWQHSQRGLILPGAFVPVAEETGLITELGGWVLRKAAQSCTELVAEYPDFYISINLSPIQITSEVDSYSFFKVLKQYERVAPNLMFEITETSLAETGQTTIQKTITQIQSLGAKVALDDFGTGFSGINYLSQLSFDYLKIDRTFTHASGTTSSLATALDGMIDLGKRFHAPLIAEGIETESQRQILVQKGIQFGQGWLYARPMPLAELQHFLSEHLSKK